MRHVPAKSPRGDAVDVHIEDRWLPGTLYSWRQRDDRRWEGYVHYTLKPGYTYVAHVDQDQLRAAEPAAVG